MCIAIGAWLENSPINTFSKGAFKIIGNYESLISTCRSIKSIAEYFILSQDYLAPFINPLLSVWGKGLGFTATHINFTFIPYLKPFASAVGKGRDFLNFFELFLRIAKLCDKKLWNSEHSPRTRLFSSLVQIPQKMLETFLLVPDSFDIINLASVCKGIGEWCSSNLGDCWVWSFITPRVLKNLKEGLALTSSILNIMTYKNDIKKEKAHLEKKEMRWIDIEQLQRAVNIAKADPQNISLLKESLEQYNRNGPELRSHHTSLQQLELKVIELQNGDKDSYEKACQRYLRRLILETDRPGENLRVPDSLPSSLKNKIDRMMQNLPTAEDRLQRVINYKFQKSAIEQKIKACDILKNQLAFWFEISKTTIIAIGLITSIFLIPAVVCALTPFISSLFFCSMLSVLDYSWWNSLLFIGLAGIIRTGCTTFYCDPAKEQLIKELPKFSQVFAVTT